VARLKHADSLTAGIESGVHNTTLAFLIAGTLLQNQEMVKAPLIYSMFSFWTALLFGFVSSKIAKHKINFL
jgi:BASS family bile acid:Na+ symporter